MQVAQEAEEERRKGRKVQEWNACTSFLHAIQRYLERRSGTTAAGSTVDKKQQQGRSSGRRSASMAEWRASFWREPTRRSLLDRLCRSNAYRAESPFGGRESGVSTGVGFAEDHIHPDYDAMGEHDFVYDTVRVRLEGWPGS